MELTIQRNLKTPIREQIVNQIVWQVASGQLAYGAKLPSIRVLSRMLGVHHNTCLHAYRKLAELGVIEIRPGSGARVAPFSETTNMAMQDRCVGPSALPSLDLLAQEFVIRVFTAGYPWIIALRALKRARLLLGHKTEHL